MCIERRSFSQTISYGKEWKKNWQVCRIEVDKWLTDSVGKPSSSRVSLMAAWTDVSSSSFFPPGNDTCPLWLPTFVVLRVYINDGLPSISLGSGSKQRTKNEWCYMRWHVGQETWREIENRHRILFSRVKIGVRQYKFKGKNEGIDIAHHNPIRTADFVILGLLLTLKFVASTILLEEMCLAAAMILFESSVITTILPYSFKELSLLDSQFTNTVVRYSHDVVFTLYI